MIDILVGLQFGSEGKGKISSTIANKYKGSIRVGAPNAGHVIHYREKEYKMRHVPCAWINKNAKLFIGPGGMINIKVLLDELSMLPVDMEVQKRLMIDRNAMVITEQDIHNEVNSDLRKNIGSTNEGVGKAQSRKISRLGVKLAGQYPELQPFIGNVSETVNKMVNNGEDILLEGTQGYGLSLNHGIYPYVTSRDVIASSILSDSGLAPSICRNVYGVMRTYPIRVAGNSGPMGRGVSVELTWEEIAKRSGTNKKIEEKTTVTKKVRRVGELDMSMLKEAVIANRPRGIFITFLDYICGNDYGVSSYRELSSKSREFIHRISSNLDIPVIAVSTGEKPDHMVWFNKL